LVEQGICLLSCKQVLNRMPGLNQNRFILP
jgi:hypothetical protein